MIHKRPLLIGGIVLLCLIFAGYVYQWMATGEWIPAGASDSIVGKEVQGTVTGTVMKLIRKDDKLQLTVKTETVEVDGQVYPVRWKVLVYSSATDVLRLGNKIVANGELVPLSRPTNMGEFNEYQYYRIQGIECKLFSQSVGQIGVQYNRFSQMLFQLKETVGKAYDKILPEQDAGVLTAMLTGERTNLDEDVKNLYQENGIGHILAISGLHVTMIGMGLFSICRLMGVQTAINAMVTIGFIWMYYFFSGSSVSTFRACVMLTVAMLGKAIGRTYDMLTGLAVACITIVLTNPLEMFHVGFILSSMSVAGIGVLLPAFRQRWHFHKILEGIEVSVATQIMTLPVLLYFFYEIPLYGVLVNCIVLPLMSILVPAGIIAGILGSIGGLMALPAEILAWVVWGVFRIYQWVCTMAGNLPFANLTLGKPALWWCVLYYIVMMAVIWWCYGGRQWLAAVGVILLSVSWISQNNHMLQVTFLDVGQGDGIFIRSPQGHSSLIDGGSTSNQRIGRAVLLPFLKSNGIRHLDYIFITHADADHVSGILELLDFMSVGKLVLPICRMEDEAYGDILHLAEEKGVRVAVMQTGDSIHLGKVSIECLHPAGDYQPVDANSYSAVFELKYESFRWLFTGDAGKEQEPLFVQSDTQYTGLKVGHHGSRESTSQKLMEQIRNGIAVISAGKGNPYGHPHNEVLDLLAQYNVMVFNTINDGAITFQTDGRQLWCSTYLNKQSLKWKLK